MFECKIDVRYYETDMQGIVHHSNYLRYLEVARELLIQEKMNMSTRDFEKQGVFFVIREAETKFLVPFKFGDEITVKVKIAEYNGLRLVHEYQLFVGTVLHATSRTMMVSIDSETFKPLNMRKKHRDLHEETLALYNEFSNE